MPIIEGSEGSVRWLGPELGEHTHEVLTEVAGYDAAEVARISGVAAAQEPHQPAGARAGLGA